MLVFFSLYFHKSLQLNGPMGGTAYKILQRVCSAANLAVSNSLTDDATRGLSVHRETLSYQAEMTQFHFIKDDLAASAKELKQLLKVKGPLFSATYDRISPDWVVLLVENLWLSYKTAGSPEFQV